MYKMLIFHYKSNNVIIVNNYYVYLSAALTIYYLNITKLLILSFNDTYAPFKLNLLTHQFKYVNISTW